VSSQARTREHDVGVRRNSRPGGFSMLLAVLGCALILVSILGFFLDKDTALIGGFLFVGAGLALASVFAPVLEGLQEFGFQGIKITIAQAVRKGEKELESEKLIEIEELA
jgi:hypothetical protein